MKQQTAANHAKYVPGYHYVGALLSLAILIGSFVNLFHATPDTLYAASLISAMSVLIIILGYFIRSFPLKAQDRAIRAEENLRHFILTGKPLPSGLRMSQIIALRFASDAELPSLAERALRENLGNKEIKLAIQHWKEDHDRL